ncbi:MAG: amidohydrolase [Chitinophagales bacterium]|nr:amidohydrolase [Chitinophagales bacterium]
MEDLKIALVQMDIVWEDRDANLNQLDQLLWDANADVIVLPEMFTTGFTNHSVEMAVKMDSKEVMWMHDLACRLGCLMIGSMIIEEKGKYFNRLICAFPDGEIKTYDKRHLFSLVDEDKYYSKGIQRLIIEYNGWKIFPLICYDLRFPVWSRNIEMAEVMIYVANWPEKRQVHWNHLLKCRAIENQSYVVGVNRIGVDTHHNHHFGGSAVYDYWGDELLNAEGSRGVYIIQLSKENIQNHRVRYGFWRDKDKFEILD